MSNKPTKNAFRENGETGFIFINGKFYPKEEAKISVYDHGLFYGDGVYEAFRTYNGKVLKIKEHINRLFDSARAIKLEIPMSKEEIICAVEETIKKNKLRNGYIRLIVTRGVGPMGVDPRNCIEPTITIIVEKRELPIKQQEEGISAVVSSLRRTPIWVLDPRIKSLNYLNNVMAKIEAIEAGADEAIMLNDKGYVAEATTENVFIVKNKKVITPPVSSGILEGITRNIVIEIARKIGYEVEERDITVYELYNADEVFLTGSAAEIVPIIRVDGRKISDGKVGPTVKLLLSKFRKLTTTL